MKALVLHEYGAEPRVEEVPRPEPGPGDVLARVGACGLGLTGHKHVSALAIAAER